MLSEVQYGGRLTDDFDKRLLKVYIDVWFTDELFGRHFIFYLGYSMPNCHAQTQYVEFINSLPATDSPEVFGLHPNASIT